MKKDYEQLSGYESRRISRIKRNTLSHQTNTNENDAIYSSPFYNDSRTSSYTQNRLENFFMNNSSLEPNNDEDDTSVTLDIFSLKAGNRKSEINANESILNKKINTPETKEDVISNTLENNTGILKAEVKNENSNIALQEENPVHNVEEIIFDDVPTNVETIKDFIIEDFEPEIIKEDIKVEEATDNIPVEETNVEETNEPIIETIKSDEISTQDISNEIPVQEELIEAEEITVPETKTETITPETIKEDIVQENTNQEIVQNDENESIVDSVDNIETLNDEKQMDEPLKEDIVENESIEAMPIDPVQEEIIPQNETIEDTSKVKEEIKEDKPIIIEHNNVKTKKENKNKNSSNNNNKRPPASKFVHALSILGVVGVVLMIIGIVGAFIFANKLCEGMPEFNVDDLASSDSSIIYDADGNEIIELGLYLRENIEYEDMPTCLIDAFISVEDSRYFEHFGFDIPRFTQAALTNLRTGDFSQGGSTITMQLIKNSYFQIDDDDNSTMAARSGLSGVARKMQEIVLSVEANYTITKQETLALYINKVNYGSNIRGVQKAAEYYFGKDAKDLSINEAAFLAGIINAPNACNPYYEAEKYLGTNAYLNPDIQYLENANDRKNEVLYLMYYHGYITEDEYNLNTQIRVEDLLAGKDQKFENTNTYYQSYIDAVIDEVEEITGLNPYATPMNIYTSMDAHMQKYLYDMQNNPEMYEQYYTFRHDLQQNALVVLNNQTGELVALGGGRNQNNSARQFNRAVDAYINPGSCIKPILEYALAFEKLGWSTSHTITDQPIFMYDTVLIANAYGQEYTGDMLITEALARSLNTPAIQTLEAVIEEIGEEEVIKYCNEIGFSTCNKKTFDLQWAIGGKDCTVSPVQLAAAHAILMNGGNYVSPHTVKKIEYRGAYNKKEDYVADTEGVQVLSEAAAWMTAYCENYNVTSGWIGQLKRVERNYPTYAKTGTTTFPDQAYSMYGIPESGAKDQWLMCQTSNYTITVWNGFDKLEDGAFFTYEDENYNLKCKMGSLILDELYNHFNYEPHGIEMPDGVSKITFVKGTFPYAAGGDCEGYIKADSQYANLISLSDVHTTVLQGYLKGMGFGSNEDGSALIYWAGFGGDYGDGTMDISATNLDGSKTVIATGRCYFPRITYTRPSTFYATISYADGHIQMVESIDPMLPIFLEGSKPITVCGWTSDDGTQKCNTFE